jgi:hypothetical protein
MTHALSLLQITTYQIIINKSLQLKGFDSVTTVKETTVKEL